MSTSVQTIYDRVTDVLLEPGGFVLGVFTEAQFLHALGVVLLDFSQRAPLDKKIFTTQINAGVSDYLLPDDLMQPQLCFLGGKLIEKVTETDLMAEDPQWKRRQDTPRQWHEDNLDVKHVEVSPTPNFNGAGISGDAPPIGKYGDFYPSERNLTVVGTAGPNKTAWTLNDTLDGIVPDSFTPYIVYGVLEQIFSSESELRDTQRAAYCHTRFQEAIYLSDQIVRMELLEADD